jgi:hypothetical protein
LPQQTPFDAKMDALDTRAAEALQDEAAHTEAALELDTAIELDSYEDDHAVQSMHAASTEAIADPLELPPAPASLPNAIDLPLELDLDIESEAAPVAPAEPAAATTEPAPEPELAPAEPELMLDLEPEPSRNHCPNQPARRWQIAGRQQQRKPTWSEIVDDPALEQQLAIETMSDAELEAALAAELAVMERSIGAPAEASDDAPGQQHQ